MVEPVTVRSQLWVKILLILGTPLLGWAGGYTLWLSLSAGFTPLLENLLLFGAGLFCIIAVLKGAPLLRFLNHTLTLHTDGLEISHGKLSRFFTWEQVGCIKGSDTFNILGIYDQGGKLIYAVDYSAAGFAPFIQQLNALTSPPP